MPEGNNLFPPQCCDIEMLVFVLGDLPQYVYPFSDLNDLQCDFVLQCHNLKLISCFMKFMIHQCTSRHIIDAPYSRHRA